MKRHHRGRDKGRSALTLPEILVVIFLTAIVAAILLPTIGHTRGEPAYKVRCAANLKTIGQAILLYTNENKGAYPRTRYVPGGPPVWRWDTSNGGAAVDPFNTPPWSGQANDVAMAVFLLIRTQDITSEVFNCPTDERAIKDTYGSAPGAAAVNKASFTRPENLSYSLANPYPDQAAVDLEGNRYVWNTTLSSEFAIAGDLNPGIGGGYDVTLPPDANAVSSLMKKANSRNHLGTGQNLLYGDGHVSYESNPFNGTKRDNVYTVSGSTDGTVTTSKTVVGSPKGGHDSVLLPTAK